MKEPPLGNKMWWEGETRGREKRGDFSCSVLSTVHSAGRGGLKLRRGPPSAAAVLRSAPSVVGCSAHIRHNSPPRTRAFCRLMLGPGIFVDSGHSVPHRCRAKGPKDSICPCRFMPVQVPGFMEDSFVK